MILLGVVLLIIAAVAHIAVLWTVGIILIVVGVVLYLAGHFGHAVGGRAHYW